MKEQVICYVQQKTGKIVKVPIHVTLWERLHIMHEDDMTAEDYLCPSLCKKGSGGKGGLSEAFMRIVKRAGIDPMTSKGMGTRKFNALTFHSLRHSFNSTLANAGVSQEVRMKLTGHSSFAMNDRYTHINIAPLASAIQQLPSFEATE